MIDDLRVRKRSVRTINTYIASTQLTAIPRRRSAILVCPQLQTRLACVTPRRRPRTLLLQRPDARRPAHSISIALTAVSSN